MQVDLATGRAGCFSGTGREKELNANNRINAAWAQPSGLAISSDQKQASEGRQVKALLCPRVGRSSHACLPAST